MSSKIRGLSRLILSLAVSLFVLALMLRLLGREGGALSRMLEAVRRLSLPLAGAYVVCQLLQTLLRAERYRLLIPPEAGADRPRFAPMFGVTMARNMFVDFLPARTGELSYVALLNRVAGVRAEAGLSSLSISLLLDFLALLLVLTLALAGVSNRGPLLGPTLLLGVAVVAGSLLLFGGAEVAARVARRFEARWARFRLARWGIGFIERLAADIRAARRPAVLVRALALSAGVRVFKYGGLLLLFRALTHALWPEFADAPVAVVLLALIAAEGAASLPVPTFMSFGTYEAGGTATLVALGYAAPDAALVTTLLHVLSQIVDYSLGGLALLVMTFVTPARATAPASAPAAVARPAGKTGWRAWAGLVLACGLAGAAALFAGYELWQFRKMGSLRPPGRGEAVDAPAEEARLRDAVRPLRGFLVWSSNRFGNHDILLLRLPDLALRRLTTHPHTETYPRISPDGRQVAFARSQAPWVSQRNPLPWDTWVIDVESGRERLLIPGGNAPTWSEDGRTVHAQQGGTRVVAADIATGNIRVLFEAGRGGLPGGVTLQTPDVRGDPPALAVTLRGRTRATVLAGPRGVRTIAGDNCQIAWAPGGAFVYYVGKGGRMANVLFRAPADGGPGTRWLDLPEPYSHEYFPRLARNGRWLVLGASAGGHEHDAADYEIFLWPVGRPETEALRVTFHSGNDNWPDVHVE